MTVKNSIVGCAMLLLGAQLSYGQVDIAVSFAPLDINEFQLVQPMSLRLMQEPEDSDVVPGREVEPGAEPQQPRVEPEQPFQPQGPTTNGDGGQQVFGGLPDIGATVASTGGIGSAAVDVVSQSEAVVRGTTDIGNLISTASSATEVHDFTRSPIMNDPRIRGYRYGQIRSVADGATWYAARPDLDTPLSRIDSSIIQDVVVIKGPYSVRYGPGFSFIDVQLAPTWRSCCGHRQGVRTGFIWDSNGDGFYGGQLVQGGTENAGYRIGYVHRAGSDYQTGAGVDIDANYKVRDWEAAFSYDLTHNSWLEFGYIRNDLTDVSLPSQVNNLDYTGTDGFTLKYTSVCTPHYDKFKVNAWYNRTRFNGNNRGRQLVIPPFNTTLTNGDDESTGVRGAVTWGREGCRQLTIGADLSRWDQDYFERDDLNGLAFGVNDSRQVDRGLFVDTSVPLNCRARVKAGARVDFVTSDTKPNAAGVAGVGAGTQVLFANELEQNHTLAGGYISGEYDLTCCATLSGGFGVSQVAPTLTDLYADVPFLSILQRGGTFFPRGNTRLDEQTVRQFDLGLSIRKCCFRGGLRGFYAEIDDFITYEHIGDNDDRTANHDATLTGGSVLGEYDVNRCMTFFGSLSYVYGMDNTTFSQFIGPIQHKALWAIPPLDGRIGVRLKQGCPNPRWGLEYTVRMVDNQGRVDDAFTGAGSFFEQQTPGFTLHDVRGYYRVNQCVRLFGGVENFGDRLYREHLDSRTDLSAQNFGFNRPFRPGANLYVGIESVY